jgi:hypothetical protein
VESRKLAFWRTFNAALAFSAFCVGTEVNLAHANWWKNRDGCLVTEHINATGDKWIIDAGTGYSYVGKRWNDRISTVVCEVHCKLRAWEHKDFQGASRLFDGGGAAGQNGNPYVGNAWNDRISSMQVWCDQ